MSFLKRYTTLFSDSIFNEFYRKIGGKIIHREKNSSIIEITNNKDYQLIWGAFYIGLGILLFVYMGRNMIKTNTTTILMLLLISLPAFGVGIGYLYRSTLNKKITFELVLSAMIINNSRAIPFDRIKEFNYTKLSGLKYSGARIPISHQLNLIVGNQEITLFTSEDSESIFEAGEWLAQQTGIKLNPIIEQA